MTWPGGWGTPLQLDGRARDCVTLDPDAAPLVIREDTARVGIGGNRTITDIAAEPSPAGLQHLVGCRGGGYLRAALAEFLPQQLSDGTPLYLLLDDISGASLIAGFAWSQWTAAWTETDPERPPRPSMEGVCIGFSPGSSALTEQASGVMTHRIQAVPSLVNPGDPYGWHTLAELPDVSMRRARRIDVWRDAETGAITIDSGFQDSAGHPAAGRIAVHEYALRATADPVTLELTSVEPDARILPFLSCTAAVHTAAALIGTPLPQLRAAVLARLAKTSGCTHLNDALRALAEVPVLLSHLDSV